MASSTSNTANAIGAEGGSQEPALSPGVAKALALVDRMSRKEKVTFLRMAGGLIGAHVSFPPAQAGGQGSSAPTPTPASKEAPSKEGKGKKKATSKEVSNPLAGSEAKASYDRVKKEVAKAKKAGEVPKDLVAALGSAKAEYFRALSKAKGTESEDEGESSQKKF